jgi:hypothetical protein
MPGDSVTDTTYTKIGYGSDDGLVLAKSSGKIGFFDTVPVAVQTGGSAAPTTTVTTITTATVTTGSTSTAPYGYATTTQADLVTSDLAAIIASLNIIKARLDSLTTSYNSTLTALQAYGVIV